MNTLSVRRFSTSALLTILALSAVALLMPGVAAAGEIYKTVDAKGRVSYSDQPSPNAQRVVVPRTSAATEAERERISKQMESYAQADAARAQKTETEQKETAAKKAAEEQRKELCKRARDRYLNFKEARRPYRRDDEGNRVYYSSTEIDAERAAAQKEMDKQCSE